MVEPRIELEFQNLGMRLHKQTKVVLHGVSGESMSLIHSRISPQI